MDPNECYERMYDALRDLYDAAATKGPVSPEATEHREEAVAALRDLADWLAKGGFPPDPTQYP